MNLCVLNDSANLYRQSSFFFGSPLHLSFIFLSHARRGDYSMSSLHLRSPFYACPHVKGRRRSPPLLLPSLSLHLSLSSLLSLTFFTMSFIILSSLPPSCVHQKNLFLHVFCYQGEIGDKRYERKERRENIICLHSF